MNPGEWVIYDNAQSLLLPGPSLRNHCCEFSGELRDAMAKTRVDCMQVKCPTYCAISLALMDFERLKIVIFCRQG